MSRAEAERLRQLRGWERTLYSLMVEMETANGDPPEGGRPPKLESMVWIAWDEAFKERRYLERPS